MHNECADVLSLFGWHRTGTQEQYLENGDEGSDCVIFNHPKFTYSVFELNALVDPHRGAYAAWGFWEEGSFTDCGDDAADLLAFLSNLERRLADEGI